MKEKMNREKNGSDTRPFNLDKILNIKKEKTELIIREIFLLVRDIKVTPKETFGMLKK